MGVAEKIAKRARAVFDHARPLVGSWEPKPWRYVPKSFNGGTGWGVWDVKEERYIPDAELLNLSVAKLRDELILN